MSLTFFGPATFLAGVAGLAALLYLLQRLRVRHREQEVVTTLFWRQAVQERRVWVFWRSFRHLWAYVLLLAIASLLWLLVAGPGFQDTRGRRHVVLLDGGAAMSRDGRFDAAVAAAVKLAADLPQARREVRLVAGDVETVLAAGEPVPLLAARLRDRQPVAAPGGFEGALLDIGVAASAETPVSVYLVGDAALRDASVDRLPETVTIDRVPLSGVAAANTGIVTLGVADAASGVWETVDVVLEIGPAGDTIPAEALALTVDGTRLDHSLERQDAGRFVIRNVPAGGGVLTATIVDRAIGGGITLDDTASITLPSRPRITVWLDDDVPEALRTVLRLDPAVTLVENAADAEVIVGSLDDANLQLIDEASGPAFRVTTLDRESRGLSPFAVIDELAIRQIDAAALAEQAGVEIRLDIENGERRRIAMWRALLDDRYDFRDTRSFPVFFARAVRWLAGRPPLVPWARAGEPLATGDDLVERPAAAGSVRVADGRTLQVSLLERNPGGGAAAADGDPVEPFEGRGLDLFGLIGLLLVALLATEWILHQRGRAP